jgi:NADH dehydrogenase
MRCRSHPDVWALGDCASIPDPEGRPYPTLAQHALREAKVLAGNLDAVLNGRSPRPFVYKNKGLMGSLGHHQAFAQAFKLRVRGLPAWVVRRTYYLLATPGWSRRLRLVIDWTFALLFRPDIVKVDLDREHAILLRVGTAGAAESQPAGVASAAPAGEARPLAGRTV